MANKVQILIETLYKGDGAKKAARDLENLGDKPVKSLDDLRLAFEEAKQSSVDLTDSVEEVEVPLLSAGAAAGFALAAVGALAAGLYAANNEFVEYGNSVFDLSNKYDISAESASRYLQVTEQIGISQKDLEKALTDVRQEGLDPATDGFDELAAALGITEESLRGLFNEVDGGLVLSQDLAQVAHDQKVAVDEMTDAWEAFTIEIGSKVAPAITNVLTRMSRSNEIRERANELVAEGMWRQQALAQAAEEITASHTDAAKATYDFTTRTEESAQASNNAALALKRQSSELLGLLRSTTTINRESEKYLEDEQARSARLYEIEQEKIRLKIQLNAIRAAGNADLATENSYMQKQIDLDNERLELQAESISAEEERKKASNQRIFDMALEQAALDGLSSAEYERFQNLQVQLGLVTRADADRAIAERQSADEFAAALSDQTSEVSELQAALDDIPSKSPYRAQIIIETVGGIPTLGGSAPGSYSGGYGASPVQLSSGYMGGFAEGGSFTVPGSGTGDRPFMMGLEPGEVVTVSPNGGGNVTINIDANVRSMNDLEYLTQEITRRIQRV